MTEQIKTEDFARMFDDGEDIMDCIDTLAARVVRPESTSTKRVGVGVTQCVESGRQDCRE